MSFITLPVSPPISFGEGGGATTITLPITLPFTLGGGLGDGTITLPVTLPMTFKQSVVGRKTVKVPLKVTCQYANETKSVKIPLKEKANATSVKIPLKEVAWVFHGLILEEIVIDKLQQPLILIEDVRSRILADVELLNGSDIKVTWYGNEVPKVEVHTKMTIDEHYDKISTHEWDEGSAVVKLGNSEYHVLLKGISSTGESTPILVGEPNFIEADISVDIPVNEKMFDCRIEYTSIYKIDINY